MIFASCDADVDNESCDNNEVKNRNNDLGDNHDDNNEEKKCNLSYQFSSIIMILGLQTVNVPEIKQNVTARQTDGRIDRHWKAEMQGCNYVI